MNDEGIDASHLTDFGDLYGRERGGEGGGGSGGEEDENAAAPPSPFPFTPIPPTTPPPPPSEFQSQFISVLAAPPASRRPSPQRSPSTKQDVSTTFSFTTLVIGAFPPSRSVFQLLEADDSPLLVTVDAYPLHKTHSQIPLGVWDWSSFRTASTTTTTIRPPELDIAICSIWLLDAVLNALAVAGHGGRIRVVVAGTGWPSQGGPNDPHATPANVRQESHSPSSRNLLTRLSQLSSGGFLLGQH
ncbi:unnamed protein product [Linum tenue]|uniref:glucan endo-1,3-beta-D-glucosidase n=1 Tax=Linum tenue TaxID=586396 RepID=A0AAV0JP78_9ROSI|nr:unnamed protein product [Linum tenue]